MDAKINLNHLSFSKIPEASAVLAHCWKHAYKGLINDEYLKSLKDNHWVEFLEKSMTNKTVECVVAEFDNQIVGITIFGQSITEKYPNDGEIISLYVIPEFIGKNIGHLLFERAEQVIKRQGYRDCTICTFTKNTRAINFYKSHGYEIILQDEFVTMGTQELSYVILRKSL